MKNFTFLAVAVMSLMTFTAKAELMDKAFYRMPTFTDIQDATVTASQVGTCPITVKSNKTNNTPRYLFTKWGEDAYAKCPAELPESGYSWSTEFTITEDAGVSNCMELVLTSDTAAYKVTHMRLLNTDTYFFRMHQAANKSEEGQDSIYINGDVIAKDEDWTSFGETNGDLLLMTPGVKYEIRVNINVEGTESKYTITDLDAAQVVAEGVKDISMYDTKHIGMIWFNTGGGCTYDFNNMILSTLQNGPFATDPTANLFWVEGTERDYFVTFEEGDVLHWIQLGDAEDVVSGETYTSGEEYSISWGDAMDTKDFEAGEECGRKIITCTESGTLKIWTSRADDENNTSDDVLVEVVCEEIQLPAPSAAITNVAEGYGKEYTLSVDNSQVVLNPTITIHYVLDEGGNVQEGDVLSGEKVNFANAGTLTLYAWDKTHKTECYAKSESVVVENNVEYTVAVDVNYQLTVDEINAGMEGYHANTIVDNTSKSHWERIMSNEARGYKEDGTNEPYDAANADQYTWVKEGHGVYDTSCIGTDDAKWPVLVPDDVKNIAPLQPSEENPEIYKVLNGGEDYAWAIFPCEGIVYYDVNTTVEGVGCAVKKNEAGAAGFVEMTLEERFNSDDEAKPNFFIVGTTGGYNRPDKGDCTATSVLVAGQKFWLYRYDTAIRFVKVMTYKGFVAAIDAIENDVENAAAPIFNLRGEKVQNMATPGFYIQNGRVMMVK